MSTAAVNIVLTLHASLDVGMMSEQLPGCQLSDRFKGVVAADANPSKARANDSAINSRVWFRVDGTWY